MITAIVPVYNEEARVGNVLRRLLYLDTVNQVFVILNGSNQATRDEVAAVYEKNKGILTLVSFKEPLGIDVPRAVGAKLAHDCGAHHALFVDGDLIGEITKELSQFVVNTTNQKLDLALMNCYPNTPSEGVFNEPIFYFRRLLNRELGLYDKLHIATPSHGPHMISRRMLARVPWEDYCVPPTIMVHAIRHNLTVGVAGEILHSRLGSSLKNRTHSELIVDTIAGDCLEAVCLAHNIPRCRTFEGKPYLGYHGQRRFDLLAEFLAGRFML